MLVTKPMRPSTWPLVSGVELNPMLTVSSEAGSILLTARKAIQVGPLLRGTPILLPMQSCGVFKGFFNGEAMMKGLVWNCTPMILSFPPLLTAPAVAAGIDSETSALRALTIVSGGAALGPPGINSTDVNPSARKYPFLSAK